MNEETAKRKLKSYLCLARKAGKLVSGEAGCENALKSGKAKLTLVCADASDNTKKKFFQKAFYYKCPFYQFLDRSELASCTGLDNRTSCVITDAGFASRIEDCIKIMQKTDTTE